MGKGKKTPFREWETTKKDGLERRYIRMGDTQMLHPSFQNLSHIARSVYIYMKLESGGKQIFEYPYSKYKKIVSKQGFQDAVKVLVESGFIEIVEKNGNLRKPNIYRFSPRWQAIK